MFILDLGSGNTCQNNIDYACSMIRRVADLQIPGVYVKWQLFREAGNNVPLNYEVFERAVRYAEKIGIKTGVSVFDFESLIYSCTYNMHFIKIANNNQSQSMFKEVPGDFKVIYSTDDPEFKTDRKNTEIIYTVSKYPADEKDYVKFGDKLKKGMSDHTTNWNLFKKYQPKIYECHFCLEDSEGLDAGKFVRRPKDFAEILNMATNEEDMLKEEYESSLHDTRARG